MASAGYRDDVAVFFSSRRRHTRYWRDWSSDVCSSDLFFVLIRRRPAPGENKERRTETCQPRRENIADIGTDIAGHVHVEEASLARVKVARYSPELTGNERSAVPIDEKDRPHLRQRVDDVLHPLVKVQLVPPDVVVGHAAHDLV